MTEHEKFVFEFLKFCADNEMCDSFWWRCDGEYAPITFFANCNDMFHWACADAEDVTKDNFSMLKQCAEDIKKIDECCVHYCDLLFCARIRGMRPQGAMYKHMPDKLWELFDACGPERKMDFGNPEPHPKEKEHVENTKS